MKYGAEITGRRALMAALAAATRDEIARGLAATGHAVTHTDLRPAETGLAMVRGRAGGDGAPFNLGEVTVTRAAVQLPTGEIGFSYVLGRDREKARLAAIADALWQCADKRSAVEDRLLAPISARIDRERALTRAETAATRVDFFTLVRGENE